MSGIDEYTKLLLHMDGDDEATDFLDDSGDDKTITVSGAVEVDVAQSVFGGASGLFGGGWLYTGSSADWPSGTDDWGVEAWVRPTSLATNPSMAAQRNDAADGGGFNNGWFIRLQSNGYIRFLAKSSGSTKADYTTTNNPVSTGSASHILVTRSGTNIYIFINGALCTTTVTVAIGSNSLATATHSLAIGADTDGNSIFYGWMDEARFVYGVSPINNPGDPLYISSGTPSDGFAVPATAYSLNLQFSVNQSKFSSVSYVFYTQNQSCHAAREIIESKNQSSHAVREIMSVVNQSMFATLRDSVAAHNQSLHNSRGVTSAQNQSLHSAREIISAQNQSSHDARSVVSAQNQSLHDSRCVAAAQNQSSHFSWQKRGWHIYARDVDAGTDSLLGFIDAAAAETKLADIALADGTYEIEARPSGLLWDACRTRKILTVKLSGSELEYSGLPDVRSLSREIVATKNIISWSIMQEYTSASYAFGLWLADASGVDISGAPDYTVAKKTDATKYRQQITQTASKYLACAAYSGSTRGSAQEIYLPWSATASASPLNQRAE